MPLSKEGELSVSHLQRESEQRFIAQYGSERFKEKLEKEGVYAYGFQIEDLRERAIDMVFDLSDECRWGEDKELKEKFGDLLSSQDLFDFDYELWSSPIPEISKVLVIFKPFPKRHFDQRLSKLEVPVREVPVYRLAELTEEEILSKRGGVLWNSYCFIDLNESIKRR